MKYYYLNLPKDKKDLDFDANMKISTAIQKTAEDSFGHFEEYLRNAINSLRKKDDVRARWKKLHSKNIAELKLEGWLFEIPVGKNRYKIITSEDFAPDFEEPIIYKVGDKKEKIQVSQTQYENRIIELNEEIKRFDSISWGGEAIELELIPEKKDAYKGVIIFEDENRKIVYVQNENEKNLLPSEKKEIRGEKVLTFVEKLKFSDGKEFEYIEQEGLTYTLQNENDFDKTLESEKCMHFKLMRPQKKDKNFYWIQLQEIDEENSKDDYQVFSPLRYFFDDGIEIQDSNRNAYEVSYGNESESKVVLRRKGARKSDYCFPEGEELRLKINTYQLEKQLEAISMLKKMPIGNHSNLIKLFEDRKKAKWKNPKSNTVQNWEVLTDTKRDGCEVQQGFVEKALNTPDFAILEGPPGSGKTTVILELISQIVKSGKRVLLCGSTHVAIDNVLERLKENKLLEKFNILPVRIGDEKRINNDVREFQIDNLIEESSLDDNKITEEFLLDASNLVCGTTIGILQNPKFKKRKTRNHEKNDTPIIPEFDYLIIDESSKTTFQEFLVPALYAKKWILVGDVMQLSPFTDRSEIVSNISEIKIDGTKLDKNLQSAVFYLQKIKECVRGKNNKFICPAQSEKLKFIEAELKKKVDEYFNGKQIFIWDNEKNHHVKKLELYAYDIIFIDRNLLEANLNNLPETHAVLAMKDWFATSHAFEHNSWQQRHNFYFKERGKELKNSFEIVENLNSYFYEKNWAEEIAWRIDREHQLRLVQGGNKSKSYGEQIKEFLPLSVDAEKLTQNLNKIAAMAFPSILESLVHGIKGRKTKIESTISEGFEIEKLRARREMLVFQQRMHPEISKFPRERFYKANGALKDSSSIDREWDYSAYHSRSVWINVDGQTNRNYNVKEVSETIEYLKKFLEYAKDHLPPDNKKTGNKKWSVACLTFYRGQETKLREKLRELTKRENAFSDFNIDGKKDGIKINIKLHTVDKFQGHEADIAFLSMVQTNRDGFLDNPNRLNVAITRAKYQLVILGKYEYFSKKSQSEDLQQLALNTSTF